MSNDSVLSWQPISALPFIATIINVLFEETKNQYKLFLAFIDKASNIQNSLVLRLYNYYNKQLAKLYWYVDQIQQWRTLKLTQEQKQQVEQLSNELEQLIEINKVFINLAKALKTDDADDTVIILHHDQIKELRNKMDELINQEDCYT